MKKIVFLLLMAIFSFSCKKNVEIEINGTRDLKNLSLPQLRKFLKGKWRWQYSVVFTIAGVDTIKNPGVDRFLLFYPVDSIQMINEIDGIMSREKLTYEFLRLPGNGAKSANILMFYHDGYDYLNKWVADSLKKDTLVFANFFRSEGVNRYYLTKEQ